MRRQYMLEDAVTDYSSIRRQARLAAVLEAHKTGLIRTD